jgi:hypothetical protein
MSVNLKPAGQLLRVPFTATGLKVDREKRIIYGMPLAQLGPFKSEGRGEFDLQSLQTILAMAAAAPRGLKSRLAHPDESHDGIDKTLGRFQDPRLDSVSARESRGTLKTDTIPAVLGDLHFIKATPGGMLDKLAEAVMDMAENDSAIFSTSLVLTTEEEPRVGANGQPLLGPDGNQLPPLWRPTALMACDCVSVGDACDGLLATALTPDGIERLPNGVVFQAVAALDKQFAGKDRAFVESHAVAFLKRYLDRRYGLAASDEPDDTEGGDSREGGPDTHDHADDIPEGSGEPKELHNGCRSTLAYHHLTACRQCGGTITACGCENVAKESRVITMAKEPCAKCLAAGEDGQGAGGDTVPAGEPKDEGDVEQARKRLAARLAALLA